MPLSSPQAMDFLLNRRSRPAKTLKSPYPTNDDLGPILTAALRSPDHGKLEPWRLMVLEKPALVRLADAAIEIGEGEDIAPEQVEKGAMQFRDSGLAVAVISAPVASPKIPEIEQVYSAGAVCLALLNAALASGWGANWLTGWTAHSRHFASEALGLTDTESVAGYIHLGTETNPPPERPRPQPDAKITWVSA